jgi:hypothetical protein
MSILLDAVFDLIRKEYQKPAPSWTIATVDPMGQDMAYLCDECNKESEFDPHHTRQTMINRLKKGTTTCEQYRCDDGAIYVVYDNPSQKKEIPWELWGRILRLYRTSSEAPFRIFFILSTHLREFPKQGKITPHHINGGYTYPCNHETVVIYRAEDATRVLIHELQHACCLDHNELGLDQVEAETEAWAELFYCGFLSRGNQRWFTQWIQAQSDWIQNQNRRILTQIGDTTAFPWRYTVAKELVWRRWGILKPLKDQRTSNSLRLTFQPSHALMNAFHVNTTSTIL